MEDGGAKHVLEAGKETGEKEGRDGGEEVYKGKGRKEGRKRREGGGGRGRRDAMGLVGSGEYHLENIDCIF